MMREQTSAETVTLLVEGPSQKLDKV